MPVALPGDVLSVASSSSSSSSSAPHAASSSSAIKLGPGLLWPSESSKYVSEQLLVTKGGLVGAVNPGNAGSKGKQGWWIESTGGSYHPSPSDPVIGQITNRNAEFYTLSISSAHPATLSSLGFEGATKRHKPNLKLGALVYAMVIPSSVEPGAGDTEPEVTCVDLTTGKSNGMGELDTKEGHCGVVEVSLNLAKSLLHPNHTLLQSLSSHMAFESAIGLNGLVWLRVSEPAHFLAARLVLEAADQKWLSRSEQKSSTADAEQQEEEKRPGEHGRKWASRWGTLDEKEIRRIVQSVLE